MASKNSSYVSEQFTSFLKVLNMIAPYANDLIFDDGVACFKTENQATQIEIKLPINLSIILNSIKKKSKMLALFEGEVINIEENERSYRINDGSLTLELLKASSTTTENFSSSEFENMVSYITGFKKLIEGYDIISKHNIISKALTAFDENTLSFIKNPNSDNIDVEIQDINKIKLLSIPTENITSLSFEIHPLCDFISLPFDELSVDVYDTSKTEDCSEIGLIWHGLIGETSFRFLSRAGSTLGVTDF